MSEPERGSRPAGMPASAAAGADRPFDLSRVVVVSGSHINRIVVGRIVESAGLKSQAENPAVAGRALEEAPPALVILDGGADGSDCDGLLPDLAAMRAASGRDLPKVIFLAATVTPVAGRAASEAGAIDRTVAKPLTPEALQPALLQLIDAARR